jgi:hypothetical protein
MNNKSLRTTLGICFVLALLAFLAIPILSQDKSDRSDVVTPGLGARALEGTWITQTQINNCSGTVLENLSRLTMFNTGGTASETSSATVFRSPAFGVWRYDGERDFVLAMRFFRFNPDGTNSGSIRATWNISVDNNGDSYTGEGAVQVVLPNGVVVANLCATETATRMVIPN